MSIVSSPGRQVSPAQALLPLLLRHEQSHSLAKKWSSFRRASKLDSDLIALKTMNAITDCGFGTANRFGKPLRRLRRISLQFRRYIPVHHIKRDGIVGIQRHRLESSLNGDAIKVIVL